MLVIDGEKLFIIGFDLERHAREEVKMQTIKEVYFFTVFPIVFFILRNSSNVGREFSELRISLGQKNGQ